MDADRFEELFKDVDRWVFQARRLKIVADHLTVPAEEAQREFYFHPEKAEQTPSFLNSLQNYRAFSDSNSLLLGLAIENACKARLILDGKIIFENGRVKGLPISHNIFEMVKSVGVDLDEEKTKFLKRLTYQIKVLAKYPIAKDLKTQNQFTGTVVGGTKEESAIVDQIIINVLRDEDIIKIYKSGHE